MNRGLESTYEVLRTIVVVLFFAFIIRAFIFQPFVVEGRSMEPAFHDRDYLIVNKYQYRFGAPERGDVIVFESPTLRNVNFIKRVVGVPGDLVRVEGDTVFVNGSKLEEPYTQGEPSDSDQRRFTTIERFLNANQYWVMGDNRDHSSDSREWGPLERGSIIGRAWVTVFPKEDFGVIQHPGYSL